MGQIAVRSLWAGCDKGETAGISPLAFIAFAYVLSACVAGLSFHYLFAFVFFVAALCEAGGKPSSGTFI